MTEPPAAAAAAASLRDLPSVHAVLEQLADLRGRFPHSLMLSEVRRAVETARAALLAGRGSGNGNGSDVVSAARAALETLAQPSLRRVINATGVVLHTNLGRAPLAPPANPGDAAYGYSNLEYDLASGRRGKRDTHLAPLLEALLGVPGIAVNNNAAATYLALNELAAGGEAIVSRGELVEIGDGFRIPDIMARSGAILREVGATNRTRLEDYAAAINDRTRLIMIVHPSNFRMQGFTGKPARHDLAALARRAGIPLYEDLGSGCLIDLRAFAIEEPRVQESLAGGASLVSFSGDKLLGGPQAGILAGEASLVARLRRNPMFRALRLDKLILGSLEATMRRTLLEQWDQIPALRMITLPAETVRERAEALLGQLGGAAELIAGQSVIGGGATPEQSIPTWLIAISAPSVAGIEQRLRLYTPPVIARIEDDRLLIDLRTVDPGEEPQLLAALRATTRS